MMKQQKLFLLFVFLLTASLCLGQDISTEENSINKTDTDSISNLNPYIENQTQGLLLVKNKLLIFFVVSS